MKHHGTFSQGIFSLRSNVALIGAIAGAIAARTVRWPSYNGCELWAFVRPPVECAVLGISRYSDLICDQISDQISDLINSWSYTSYLLYICFGNPVGPVSCHLAARCQSYAGAVIWSRVPTSNAGTEALANLLKITRSDTLKASSWAYNT
jgi:hypothetical protein